MPDISNDATCQDPGQSWHVGFQLTEDVIKVTVVVVIPLSLVVSQGTCLMASSTDKVEWSDLSPIPEMTTVPYKSL